jgi:hypothetical protein
MKKCRLSFFSSLYHAQLLFAHGLCVSVFLPVSLSQEAEGNVGRNEERKKQIL